MKKVTADNNSANGFLILYLTIYSYENLLSDTKLTKDVLQQVIVGNMPCNLP